jgi:hypothetical protein
MGLVRNKRFGGRSFSYITLHRQLAFRLGLPPPRDLVINYDITKSWEIRSKLGRSGLDWPGGAEI